MLLLQGRRCWLEAQTSPETSFVFRSPLSPGQCREVGQLDRRILDAVTSEEFQQRQADATALIAATEDNVDREILKMAYSAMIGRLLRKQPADVEFVFEPVELLETLKVVLKHKEVISGLISGKYATLDEACKDLEIFSRSP